MPKAVILLCAVAIACGGAKEAPAPTAEDALAAAAATRGLPTERYVSPTGGFDLDLPGIWKGRYRAIEQTDTTDGGALAVDFRFVPDSGSKAPSLTLLRLRVFARAAWEAAEKRHGRPFGARIGERGDSVFLLFLPESNPYPAASPEAPLFDQLIISIAQGGQQVHLTTR